MGDDLLGHFVDAARRAGLPWSRIGTALAVTRQAAQQRFVPSDLSRFTEGARLALDAAEAAARRLGQPAIASEQVLVGLAEGHGSVAGAALSADHLTPEVI
ncbi:MAG: Clp protease N-terminal domain-containing protein, partial [Acidimicrobiales bacterium]